MHIISTYWQNMQASIFSHVEIALGESLTEKDKRLMAILDIVGVEKYVPVSRRMGKGRKSYDLGLLSRCFVAKSYLNISQTKMFREMLIGNQKLRRICGFDEFRNVPSESVLSRGFSTLASLGVADKVHAALVREHVSKSVVMHVSRDSTEIPVREKPSSGSEGRRAADCKRRRGRPRKGEEPAVRELTRLERQFFQTPEESLSEIKRTCGVGAKLNTRGRIHAWVGYKVHIDWADGEVPLNVVTTSACVHDSQLAIPMARITADRVTSLYDLMDSAYDSEWIRRVSESLGHVPIIDVNKRRRKCVTPMEPFRKRRYAQRTNAERGNSRLKDDFGLRMIRVRGHAKVHQYVMFAVLALFADQLLKIFSG